MNYDKLINKCDKLNHFYKLYGFPKHTPKNEKFSGLIKIITGQLLSNTVAQKIYERTINTIQGETETHWLNLTFDDLRQCGLSKAKINTITNIANDINNNKLNLQWLVNQDSKIIYNTLIKYKGIGDWSAKGYALMQLQKEDFFLFEDLGVKDGVKLVMNLNDRPSFKYCQDIYNKFWYPYGGSATRLLWHFKDSAKK